MFQHLFGAKFRKIDTRRQDEADDSLVWHKDIQMYSVWNVDGPEEFLGVRLSGLLPT
jgi:Zn-dependent oligopeptidase